MSKLSFLLRTTLWLSLSGLAGAVLFIASAFLYLSPKLPAVDVLRDVQLQTPLRIYTRDGELIGEFGEKRRTPISFKEIPQDFIHAIIAAEDDRFYAHHGVDIKGLLRAASQLLATGAIQSGGSTITMQVAKNYFLSHERTFSRKFNEIFLALQIENELSKEEILELYLNKIFLGNRAYGIEAAAQVYYGKSMRELSLDQMAMIAGLPKAPSAYNPVVNPERATIRRNWILGRMLELEYIDPFAYQQAVNAPVTAKRHGAQLQLDAAYAAELAHQELLQNYGRGIYTEGYTVYTTVDAKLQSHAQQAVIDGLLAYDKRHGYRGPEAQHPPEEGVDSRAHWLNILNNTPAYGDLSPAIVTQINDESATLLLANDEEIRLPWADSLQKTRRFVNINTLSPPAANLNELLEVGDLLRLQRDEKNRWQLKQLPNAQASLVSLDSSNGAILSLVGGFDFQQSKFNRITQAARQPGSNFKPFVYTAALAKGYSPASIINDAPIVFEDASLESTWRPTNSSGKFLGPTRLRKALYQSRNLVSIRLLRSLGIRPTIDYVSRFGFNKDELPKDLSLALGSHSMKPIEIVSAYAVLANGGYKVEPFIIDRIEDLAGETIFSARPATVCQQCDKPDTAVESTELATLEDILDQVEPLPEAPRVVEPRTAFLIDNMLRDVVKKGTGRRALTLRRSDLAGKTGTTNGPTDAWFSGYGGGIVTTTWLGFDNNALIGRREYGGSAALPIWIDYMRVALQGRPEFTLPQPTGVVTAKIDPDTGLLAQPGQLNAIFEYFRAENLPKPRNEIASPDIDEGLPSGAATEIF